MTDFKVGDKVTVTNSAMSYYGREGKVTSTDSGYKSWPLRVEGDGWGADYAADEIALVTKFQVGDWVKVFGRGDKWDGTVGTVQKVKTQGYSSYGNLYTIHKNDVGDSVKKVWSDNVLVFFEDQLVATDAPPKFQIGQYVKQKPGVYGHDTKDTLYVTDVSRHTGRVGVSNEKGQKLTYKPSELEPTVLGLTINSTEIKSVWVDNWVKPADMVNGPSHYGGAANPYEAIKVAEAWGFEKNAYLFNALKYLARAGKKGSKVEDLKKLVYYVQREIALEEAK